MITGMPWRQKNEKNRENDRIHYQLTSTSGKRVRCYVDDNDPHQGSQLLYKVLAGYLPARHEQLISVNDVVSDLSFSIAAKVFGDAYSIGDEPNPEALGYANGVASTMTAFLNGELGDAITDQQRNDLLQITDRLLTP